MDEQKKSAESSIVVPPNALRKKIGMHVVLNNIFTAEKIEKCQHMIDDASADVLKEAQAQVAALLRELPKAKETGSAHDIALLAYDIKKKMEGLGLVFGFAVTQSLYDYAEGIETCTPNHWLVIDKHVEVLSIVMKNGIARDGGFIGKEMLENLRKMVKKIES
jgi:hypothetical protein